MHRHSGSPCSRHASKQKALRNMIFALALCGTLASNAAWAEKTLTVCTQDSPEGFDIAQYTSAVTGDATSESIYNQLTGFEPGTTKVIPNLAESWSVSPDGLVYTFKLRQGVKFQTTAWFTPTRDFNADDVVFSFKRMIDKTHPWNKLAKIGFKYAAGMGLDKNIVAVDKLDPYTVRFTLGRPEAPMLANFAMGFASIFSAEYADQLLKSGKTDDLNFKPVGTGAFLLQRYDKDAVVRFAAHPQYWRGKSKIDRLIFAITKDPSVRTQRLRAGECQIALQVKNTDLPVLESTPGVVVNSIAGLTTAFLSINVTHKAVDNKLVRQALNMAVDKTSMIKALYGEGNAIPAINPFPPSMWGWAKDVKDYPYDPVKAKALLAQAGYPNGLNLLMITRTSGGTAFPNPKLAAELVQSDFRKIGVNLTLQPYDFGEMLKRVYAGEHDLSLQAWYGDNGDPDNFLFDTCDHKEAHDSSTLLCDPAYDKLIIQGRTEGKQEQRVRIYEQAQRYFKDLAVWIPIAHPKEFTALKKNVTGYTANPLGTHSFYTVDLQ